VFDSTEKIKIISDQDQLELLHEISAAVQESSVVEDSFENIMYIVGRLIDFRSASLYVMANKSGQLNEICTIGRRVDLIDFVQFDMGSGISAWVAQKRRPIILNNVRKSEGGAHTRSFLSVPIALTKEIIGVVNLAHDEPHAFSQNDAKLMEIISSLLALLAERIEHKKYSINMEAQIESFETENDNMREELKKVNTDSPAKEFTPSENQRINNSLAIITGNAQFLMMTLKDMDSSITRRLQTIDSEAANLLCLTENMSQTYKESGNPGFEKNRLTSEEKLTIH
jgi:signal transduction protein with GAF and PtsI domain